MENIFFDPFHTGHLNWFPPRQTLSPLGVSNCNLCLCSNIQTYEGIVIKSESVLYTLKEAILKAFYHFPLSLLHSKTLILLRKPLTEALVLTNVINKQALRPSK